MHMHTHTHTIPYSPLPRAMHCLFTIRNLLYRRVSRVRFLPPAGRWTEAVKAASVLVKFSDARGLAPLYARLLLELSRARLGAEPSSPVGALPHALRCLAVCESYSLDATHASAMIHLAEVRRSNQSIFPSFFVLLVCRGRGSALPMACVSLSCGFVRCFCWTLWALLFVFFFFDRRVFKFQLLNHPW